MFYTCGEIAKMLNTKFQTIKSIVDRLGLNPTSARWEDSRLKNVYNIAQAELIKTKYYEFKTKRNL